MATQTLVEIAQRMVRPPGGILAADESKGTDEKRLAAIGLPGTRENRLAWRQLMASASLTPAVNAVILPSDLLAEPSLIAAFTAQGVLVGVKIDGGLEPFNGSVVEEVTKGSTDPDLPRRLAEANARGARFTKFRSFFHIDTGRGFPSADCLGANLKIQAVYARLSQEAGLVPMVEPEVDMVGTHSLADCQRVTEIVLRLAFDFLKRERVNLRGMVLKPNMVVSGKKAAVRANQEEVATSTVRTLRTTVPASVPGIAFLSGGQADEEAYANLDAIVRAAARYSMSWQMTYSFGRAAQDTARQVWKGDPANTEAARRTFEEQLARMSQARMGQLAVSEEVTV